MQEPLNIQGKRCLVTGSSSMLGRAILEQLDQEKAIVLPITHIQGCDLLNLEETFSTFFNLKPDYVIHCGGYNGNIQMNAKEPAHIFGRTARMALNVLEVSAALKVKKVVSLVSSCSYPNGLQLLQEEDFLSGAPHESVEAHGFAKRILFEYSRQLYKQFGLISVCSILNACFGPYDSYDLNKTKVTGSLIKRFIEAKENGDKIVVLWGSGYPKRELLYCKDAARLVVDVLKYYQDTSLPLNVGTGWDISIKQLAEVISNIVGFEGSIEWDKSKSDGQMKKLLDVSRMHKLLPPQVFYTLYDSLTETIEWYKQNRPF